MVLCGIILGVSGALFHIAKISLKLNIKLLYIGLVISIISTVATILIFGEVTRSTR
ncbi:MAG: hypothetical protein ACC657_09865 [Thiohalomonadales bacterium]